MRVNENGQYVSDDGFWVWDGAAWVPADGSATPAADTAATETGAETAATEPALAQATQEQAAVDYASDTTAAATGDTTPGSLSAWAAETTPDQGSLAGGDRVVPQVDSAHPMSPDGRHWWDGERWHDVSTDATSLATAGLAEQVPAVDTPAATESFTDHYADSQAEPEPTAAAVEATPVVDVAQAAVEPAKPERQLSPDGMWEWNGTQWIPAEQAEAPVVETVAAPEPEPEPEPVKAERQLSPDGHWEWDGTAWVPAQQTAVAAVPEGAHVSPDGHWWWDGSQWLPTGR